MFQDFAHVDLSLQQSVGIGWLPDVDSPAAVLAAVDRARADRVVQRVGGVQQIVGSGYADGEELSGGEWQSIGFARALMRTDSLLMSLDEPGSALDALAEQRMCDAYQVCAADTAASVGGVTLFVTHRLSTVRLADLIIVLDDGSVIESGSHDELVARGGAYADLFALQRRAYTS